jgi:hypothetical protein
MKCNKCGLEMVRVPDLCMEQTSSSAGMSWNAFNGNVDFLFFDTQSGLACLLDPRSFVRFWDWVLLLGAIGAFCYGIYLGCYGLGFQAGWIVLAGLMLVVACWRMVWYKYRVDKIWFRSVCCPTCRTVTNGSETVSVWNFNKLFKD